MISAWEENVSEEAVKGNTSFYLEIVALDATKDLPQGARLNDIVKELCGQTFAERHHFHWSLLRLGEGGAGGESPGIGASTSGSREQAKAEHTSSHPAGLPDQEWLLYRVTQT